MGYTDEFEQMVKALVAPRSRSVSSTLSA
jgi:hypothetical protein